MNYLAHFHLSYGSQDLLLGALLGDFVKGPLRGERRPELEQGILLHRKIDAFTDSHPHVRSFQQQLPTLYRRYAGIMTDVAFDHFLNRHWQQFHHQSLDQFSTEIFQLLTQSTDLTSAAQRQADNLSYHDVFNRYQHWQTVDAALQRIGQRFQRDNPLASAGPELQRHYDTLQQLFLNFYPELQHYAAEIRKGFNQRPSALNHERVK